MSKPCAGFRGTGAFQTLFLSLVASLGTGLGTGAVFGGDCNQNGVPDELDLLREVAPALPVRFFAGGGPQSMATGDLDGDGDLDLAVAVFANKVLIFLNRGRGIFEESAKVELELTPTALMLGDLDGDSDLDLAVTAVDTQAEHIAGALFVIPNQGGATFGPPLKLVTEASPRSLAGLDLENDGDLDLAVTNRIAGTASLFRNLGMDGFRGEPSLPVGVFPLSLLAVDFDQNGFSDLLLVSELTRVVFLANPGDGALLEGVELYNHPALSSVNAADLDGDGRPDIIVTTDVEGDDKVSLLDEGSLVVLLNDGKGSFPRALHLIVGYQPLASVAADFNGNGNPDLAVINRGTDHGPPPCLYFLYDLTRPAFSEDRNGNGAPDECESLPFHRGDANGDGALDVSDGLCVLAYLFTGGPGPACKEAADANNDGVIDCSDSIFTLGYLFLGTAPPRDPDPPGKPCAPDSDLLGAPGFLGCERYDPCR